MRRALCAIALGCAAACLLGAPRASFATDSSSRPLGLRQTSPPVLAYYYIWFDRSSWSRAKTDRPELGSYSSDDAAVMRQHVRWAKQAGIAGFIVSWKHTPTLDRRLRQLVDIAAQEHFGLGIVYQGLDFHRHPLPADRVASDLDYFAATFAGRDPFKLFSKPLVVWSGTWKFTPEEVARVTTGRRSLLTILASERNVAGYARIAGSVDGDSYYWSSVNPSTFPGYVEKLSDLGRAVHASGGMWIAPAAPGFDARAIGGRTTVARAGDQTFVQEIDTSLASSPDALGIISWNEFSENSHIEPGLRYGWTALNAVGVRLGGGPVGSVRDRGTGREVPSGAAASGALAGADAGHDATASGQSGLSSGLWVIVGFALLFVGLVVVTTGRGRRPPPLRTVEPVEPSRTARRRHTPLHLPVFDELRTSRRSRRS